MLWCICDKEWCYDVKFASGIKNVMCVSPIHLWVSCPKPRHFPNIEKETQEQWNPRHPNFTQTIWQLYPLEVDKNDCAILLSKFDVPLIGIHSSLIESKTIYVKVTFTLLLLSDACLLIAILIKLMLHACNTEKEVFIFCLVYLFVSDSFRHRCHIR